MANVHYTDPLLEQLVQEKQVTARQCQDVLEEHQRTGKPVREVIIDMDLVAEPDLLEVIAGQLGTRVVKVKGNDLEPEVYRSIPASVARMYSVVPVEVEPHAVVMATYDLLSPAVVDELMFVLNRDVSFVVAPEEEVRNAVARYYGDESESVGDMLSALEDELEDAGDILELKKDDIEQIDLEQAASAAPVVRFVNLVLYQAAQDRASDIHFEPFQEEFKIRYRVDGALYEMAPPPKHLALPVTSRIKVMSGLNIAERRLPQDGRIQLHIAGRPIDFRVSCLPTQYGESVVLRVLDRAVISLDLENLGMPDDVFQHFTEDIVRPNGIIIVTGPTGCGKTTTLYSALKRINTIESKLLTAEEPVEYDVEGIIQIPMNEGIGLTFGRTLRAFLRQDPDIIMVGEVRDLDTAQIAIQASLTGHLVFSTLHTNDASGAITRLIDMGVEPFLISSTLQTVLGQRLVRTICEQCKTAYDPDAELAGQLGLSPTDMEGKRFSFGQGCGHCNETGYRGRCGIFEYLTVTDPIRDLISERKPSIAIRDKGVELGMRTMRHDGVRCVLDGYTTAEEVLKYT